MKIHHFSLIAVTLLLAGGAQAGSIDCGGTIINDGQLDGQFTSEILAACGEPTSREGNDWLYDRSDDGQGIYVLHFDDSGQLQSIEEQIEEE